MNRFSPKLLSIHLAPPDICPAIGNASKEHPIIIPIIREQHDVPRENPSPGILIKPRAIAKAIDSSSTGKSESSPIVLIKPIFSI